MFDLEVQPLPSLSLPVAPRVILVTALGAAVALDLGVRGGVTNLFVAAGCALVVLVLLRTSHQLTVGARSLLLASLLPIGMLVLRASPWLAASNAAAIAAPIGGGVLYHRTGSVFDATPMRWMRRAAASAVTSLSGWRIFEPIVRSVGDRHQVSTIVRVLRAALVAAPFIVGTLLLLQAGDAVFAAFVNPDIDLGPVMGHGIWSCCSSSGSSPFVRRRKHPRLTLIATGHSVSSRCSPCSGSRPRSSSSSWCPSWLRSRASAIGSYGRPASLRRSTRAAASSSCVGRRSPSSCCSF